MNKEIKNFTLSSFIMFAWGVSLGVGVFTGTVLGSKIHKGLKK